MAFSSVLIIVGRLVREAWRRYRCNGHPLRRPRPIGAACYLATLADANAGARLTVSEALNVARHNPDLIPRSRSICVARCSAHLGSSAWYVMIGHKVFYRCSIDTTLRIRVVQRWCLVAGCASVKVAKSGSRQYRTGGYIGRIVSGCAGHGRPGCKREPLVAEGSTVPLQTNPQSVGSFVNLTDQLALHRGYGSRRAEIPP
jgi:hypothetical protein